MNNLFFKRFLKIGGLLLFSGCSTLNPLEIKPIEDSMKGPPVIYGTTAAVRNMVVRDKDSGRIICAEPMPDAAFDDEDEFDWDFSFISFGGDEKGEEQSGSVEAGLGGRSPNVLITREVLYRFCEFIGNTDFTNDEKAAMFKDVLDSVVEINKVSLGTGTRAQAGTSMDIESGHATSQKTKPVKRYENDSSYPQDTTTGNDSGLGSSSSSSSSSSDYVP